jgi:hypothetical protein
VARVRDPEADILLAKHVMHASAPSPRAAWQYGNTALPGCAAALNDTPGFVQYQQTGCTILHACEKAE